MASTRKFNTRSVPKAPDISSSSNNASNKNNNNKNLKVPTSSPNTPVNKTKKPSQMEVDPKLTDDLYIDTTTHDTPYSTPSSPIGFTSDNSDDENNNTWQEVKYTSSLNKGKEKQTSVTPKLPIDWQTEYGRYRYKMFIEAQTIPGQNINQKINLLTKILAHLESFISIRTTTQQDTQIITAIFGSISDANKAKNITLDDNTTIHMQEAPVYNGINAKNKTIRAWDIPLNVIPDEVCTIFTKYGEVKSLKMQTIGMWQSANIEFLNQDDYNNLVQRWSIPFKADLIRIFPFLNTNVIKNERSTHTIRLTNLPPGTTGFDLKDIIKENKAHTPH